MKYKNIIITHMLFMAVAGQGAWAQGTYHITENNLTWNDGLTLNNLSDGYVSALRAEDSISSIIKTAKGVDVSNNHAGVFFSDGASITLISSVPDNQFQSNNNRWEGILVESKADFTISGMNVSSNGNKDNGIRANAAGQLSIEGADKVEFNNNAGKGIFAFAADSVVSISGKDNHSSFLFVNDNNATAGWGGGIWSEDQALVSITNMNTEVKGNGLAGIMARSGGRVDFLGDGRQYLHVIQNGLNNDGGMIVRGNSLLNITGMDVLIKDNGTYGLQVAEGSTANIISADNIKNTLSANGNKNHATAWTEGAGLAVQGVASQLVVQNMDVQANGNGRYGIRATEGGVLNIVGGGDNNIDVAANNSADGNMGDGIIVDHAASNGDRSAIYIQDMNLRVDDQAYQGIAARDGGIINISSTSGKHLLEVYNTRMANDYGQDLGKGLHAKGADSPSGEVSTLVIKDMDIIANNNELEGVVVADSGVIHIESQSGKNTLIANANRQYAAATPNQWSYGAGLLAHGVSANTPDKQAAIIIKNMHIEANDNGVYGLYARDGGVISITGDGSQKLDIKGNKSTNFDTYDAGVAIEGFTTDGTSQKPAVVEINNMQVTINDNGRYGIDINSGGQMSIASDTGNTLTVSGNQTANSAKNEGMGIHVNGIVDDIQSRLDIVDMDVLIDQSPDAGLKAGNGALVNIVSHSGTNTLRANNNDNYGTQYNEGAGLFAFDSKDTTNAAATINVVGMNIEAKHNGSYGVLSEGGKINIQGNGGHTLDVEGNGRYGLLAKDGGNIAISGMNVSGNSQAQSMAGIERDGLIHLANSTITTDNDALFYTWSDSDTQKAQFVLDGSVAEGHGKALAQFYAHHSTLSATDSSLTNAMLTDHASGASSTVTLNRSTWAMKANSDITHLTANHSLVDLRGSGQFNTLTVAGNYAGNNSTLVMNTALGDDDSQTDKLVVSGDTSGITNVLIHNAGGSGAKTLNGIEVIEVGGQSVGEFVQSGRIVAGSYEYFLGRGNGNSSSRDNWYLTNIMTPIDPTDPIDPIDPVDPIVPAPKPVGPTGPSTYRPETGSYLGNLAAANTMFNLRLHDRIGDTQYTDLLTGEEKVTSLWLRQIGGHTRFDTAQGQLQTQTNRYVVQLGGDLAQWSDDGLDRWHLGLMAGYGNAQSNTESNVSHYRSRGQVNGYSVGVYGTWYANDEEKTGSYLDSWVLYNWFKNSVTGQGLASEKYSSAGFTASVEGGYSYLMGQRQDGRSSWWLQPKAQLTWMGVQADNHTETNGTRVKGKNNGNLQTRLGMRAYIKGHNAIDDDKTREFQPFVEANWIHNSGSYGVSMNGVTSRQQGTRNLGELKAGVEGQLNQNLHLWGNVAQQVGDKGYSDTQGMVGIKYAF